MYILQIQYNLTELHDIEGNKNVYFASRVGDEQLYIVGHRAKNNVR